MIGSLLATLLLTAPTVPALTQWPVDEDVAASAQAWETACTIQTRYDCTNIDPPKVRLMISTGFRGGYDGSDSIYVNRNLKPGVDKLQTMVHEMLHYLQVMYGTMDLAFLESVYRGENEAFKISDTWHKSIGEYYLTRGTTWWIDYPKCWHWYAPQPVEGFNLQQEDF